MFEWNKQLLRKNRYTTHEQTQKIYEEQRIEVDFIDQMQIYFYRLFMILMKLKYSPSALQTVNVSLEFIHPIIPENMPYKQQTKAIFLFFRRVKNLANSYPNESQFFSELDEIFTSSQNSPEMSLSIFFNQCCDKIIKDIHSLQQKSANDFHICVPKLRREIIEKISYKQLSQSLTKTIYDILDVESVELCFLLIQGAALSDNVNYAYDKIKEKNKKARKQIIQFSIQMTCHRKQRNDKKESYVLQKKENFLEPIHKNKIEMSIKQNKINLHIKIGTRSITKSEGKQHRESVQLQKQRIKLKPITKNTLKLKINH